MIGKFYDLGRKPLVCGCVDGTLIEVDAPSDNEMNLADQHGNHSISHAVVRSRLVLLLRGC